MPQPYDYSLNIPSPMDAFSQAFNVGAAGQKARYAREDREAGIARKEAETAAVDGFFAKPIGERTQEDYLILGRFNPQLAELAQSQWDNLSEERQQVAFRDATQIHTALINTLVGETDPEIVDQIFARRVEGTTGDPGLHKMWIDARELARTDPEAAEAMVGTRIAQLPGGKDYFLTMASISKTAREAALQPGKVKEQKLRLVELEDKIKWKQFEGFQALAEAGVDITEMVSDDPVMQSALEQISTRQNQLDLAEGANNALAAEKLTLEIQGIKDSIQEKAQTKINDVGNAMAGSVDLIEFIDEIIKYGGDWRDESKPLHESTGSYAGFLWTFQQPNVNYEKMIETLKSKIYLDKVALMRGTGPLSDREGAKLETAVRSLDLRQDPETFYNNLIKIQKLAVGNQVRIQEKYGDLTEIQAAASRARKSVQPSTPLMSGNEVFITVTTQEEFDQLPSGSEYIGSDGIKYRKQ